MSQQPRRSRFQNKVDILDQKVRGNYTTCVSHVIEYRSIVANATVVPNKSMNQPIQNKTGGGFNDSQSANETDANGGSAARLRGNGGSTAASQRISDYFGSNVFGVPALQEYLPKNVFRELAETGELEEKLRAALGDDYRSESRTERSISALRSGETS